MLGDQLETRGWKRGHSEGSEIAVLAKRRACIAAFAGLAALCAPDRPWHPGVGEACAEGVALVDFQETRVVRVEAAAAPREVLRADVAVIGGGVGGIAAALAACEAGRTVVLAEETDWLGGQFTAQGMSVPDENQFIERGGGTLRYQAFRRRIRDWYRRHRRLAAGTGGGEGLNPGNCWASRLCCEPHVALAVIEEMIAPHRDAGRLRLLLRHKALRAYREGERVALVDLADLNRGDFRRVEAELSPDATELGDLLPLAGVPHVTGAESREETLEPHALPGDADPGCMQSFTYTFIVENTGAGEHVIPRPPDYELNRERQPFSPRVVYYDDEGEEVESELLMFRKAENQQGSFWRYRRIVDRGVFAPGVYPNDLAIVNWPGNDYRGDLIGGTPDEIVGELRAAKNLSLGFLHWLQTELPNDNGSRGYPALRLRKNLLGSRDGLAKYPYVRESRRIRTRRPLREQDISASLNRERFGGKFFSNSIGIAYYPMDVHPGDCEEQPLPRETWPFQLPLDILVPLEVTNLIPAGKCAGTTHITGSCTRLHPVEWAIGEAAGTLASLCFEGRISPAALRSDVRKVRELQRRLLAGGAPIYWYTNLRPTDPGFAEAQMAPFFSDSLRQLRARKPTGIPSP